MASALVADFGIALAVSTAGTRMTETGMSLGTPHYMSPEQAMGEREITATSDVYALGCVLYEMLVGEPPFTGPTAQAIIARVVTEEPRSLTIQRKTIPENIEAAVEQALQKLPADRFTSAAAFAAALQGQGTASMTRARPRSPAAQLPRRLTSGPADGGGRIAARGAGARRRMGALAPEAGNVPAGRVAVRPAAPRQPGLHGNLPGSGRLCTRRLGVRVFTSHAGVMLRYADQLEAAPGLAHAGACCRSSLLTAGGWAIWRDRS